MFVTDKYTQKHTKSYTVKHQPPHSKITWRKNTS